MIYTHLSQHERYQIQHLHRGGFTNEAIGEHICRPPSTVGRELRRNEHNGCYDSRQAHRLSKRRRSAASSQPRIPEATWLTVRTLLGEHFSPAQIVGSGQVAISHERIYQYIAADRQRGGSLWTHLRCRKQRRRHRCGTPRQRFGGRRIGQRPAVVERRLRVGDWEGDSIVGSGPVRILTLVERKTGLARLCRVASGAAEPMMRAIVQALHPICQRVHTLTWDNGSEFAEHAVVDIALAATSYFADPYSAWQRGCNENLNGLLRQYFPKGCDLGVFTDDDIQEVQDALNRRPRKRLGFRTPQQMFDRSFKHCALQS